MLGLSALSIRLPDSISGLNSLPDTARITNVQS